MAESASGPRVGWGRAAALMTLAFLGFPVFPLHAEPVAGQACYRFGDRETRHAARFIALSLAKRDALEKYAPYSEATQNLAEAQLRNELVTELTARLLKGLKVTGETEDAAKSEVCRAVTAEVDPEQTKALIASVVAGFRARQNPVPTGLPENGAVRLIQAEEGACPDKAAAGCLHIVAECRRNTFGERHPVRIIWYDAEGRPAYSRKERFSCEAARDVKNLWVGRPPPGFTFTLDLPER